MAEPRVANPAPGLWVLWNEGINLYLVAGGDRAVLLDSGFGDVAHLRGRCEALCGRPVELIHTHTHGDHTGGDGEWSQVWIHPAEWADYRRERGDALAVRPLEDGMSLDLGGRQLEVVHVPGHTPGSVALLDRQDRRLFSGDTVMTQPVFLFAPNSSIPAFRSSLERLKALLPAYDTVYPSHQRWPLDPGQALDCLLDCAGQALAGQAEGLVTIPLDMGFSVVRFACYQKGDYSVAVRDLGPVPPEG